MDKELQIEDKNIEELKKKQNILLNSINESQLAYEKSLSDYKKACSLVADINEKIKTGEESIENIKKAKKESVEDKENIENLLKKKLEEMTVTILDKIKEIEKLNAEISDKKTELEKVTTAYNKNCLNFAEEVTTLKSEINILIDKSQSITKEITGKNLILAKVTKEIEEKQGEFHSVCENVAKKEVNLEVIKNNVVNLTNDKLDCADKIDVLNKTISENNKIIVSQQKEIKENLENIEKVKQEYKENETRLFGITERENVVKQREEYILELYKKAGVQY